MARVGTVFTSSVLCFVADAAPRPGPDEVMNFKAHQVLHLFDLISLFQVCLTTPFARTRAREVMSCLRLEAMKRLRISLPKLPSMGRVVFHLVCPEPAFAFRAMGSMLELGKVFHLGGAVAKKAEKAAAFLEGLYERSCRLMRVREAMFLDTVGVVQAEIEEPPKEQDRLIVDIEDYLFDYGATAARRDVCACRLVMSGPPQHTQSRRNRRYAVQCNMQIREHQKKELHEAAPSLHTNYQYPANCLLSAATGGPGALDRDLPLCSELRLLVRPDEAPGHFRRFVKAAAAGLEVFSKDGTPECKEAFEFYRDLAKTHALDELRN